MALFAPHSQLFLMHSQQYMQKLLEEMERVHKVVHSRFIRLQYSLETISMNQKIISGFGFGSSGRIFIKGWIGGVSLQDTLDLTNQPNPAEVPLGAISTWSDKAIICSESEIEKLTGGKAAPILVQVVTSTGTKSNVFSGVSAPSAPTGLKVTVSPQ